MKFGEKYKFVYIAPVADGKSGMIGKYKCIGGLCWKDGKPVTDIIIDGKNLPTKCNVVLKVEEGECQLLDKKSIKIQATKWSLEERAGDYLAKPMYCRFKKMVFYNQDNGYTIAKYNIVNQDGFIGPDGKSIYEVTCIGHFLPLESAMNITFDCGKWCKNKFGDWQLNVKTFKAELPDDEQGMFTYLASLKGCGEKTATRLIEKFGKDVYKVLESDIDKVAALPRVSMKKALQIQENHLSAKPAREIVQFLGGYGVTVNKALRIFKYYTFKKMKPDSIMDIIKNEPFSIIEIDGFGFRTADNIAKAMKLDSLSIARIRSAILFVLDEEKNMGHLYTDRKDVISKTCKVLNENPYPSQKRNVTPLDVNRSLSKMIDPLKMVYKEIGDEIYLTSCWNAETSVSNKMIQLVKSPLKNKIEKDVAEEMVEETLKKFGFKEAKKQADASVLSLTSPVSIITGGPGTGKTSIIKIILEVYTSLFPKANIKMCAPTGRAAQRMTESTGRPSSTIHRLLCLTHGAGGEKEVLQETSEDEEEMNPLNNVDLLIIDESSMLDIFLARTLLEKINPGTQVILVGDAYQLPPIGPGAFFNDAIESKVIPTTTLNQIFRQEGINLIAENAAMIKEGRHAPKTGDDYVFIEQENSEDAEKAILDELKESLKDGATIDKIQILVPTRQEKIPLLADGKKDYASIKSRCNATTLNRDIQEMLNPSILTSSMSKKGKELAEVRISNGAVMREKDKVMQIKNDYSLDVFNGDVGYVKEIYFDDDECLVADILFPDEDNRIVTYSRDKFKELTLAYATTIHKSQGSEYEIVITAMLGEHYHMLRRNIIYTAITRARNKVVMIGKKQYYAAAIDKIDTNARRTKLQNRLIMLANDIEIPNRGKDIIAEILDEDE